MGNATLKLNVKDTIDSRVAFCWPKPDTRIPEAQRPTPEIEGFVDCEYTYFSEADLEKQDAQVENGDLDAAERFHMLVPVVKGLPLDDGETAADWLKKFKYGSVIRLAILEDYYTKIREGRRGNSGKSRSR